MNSCVNPGAGWTRRSVLQGLAAAALPLLAGRTGVSQAAPPSVESEASIQLGLVTYLWAKDWDLPTILENCRRTGILGVELRTQHAHGVEVELSAAERKEVRKRFADSPVTLLGPGTNWEFHSPDPSELKRNLESARASVILSHDVGGTGVKVKPNALPRDVPREKTIAQIGRSLNELAEFAEGYGQQIRVEVHGRDTQQLPVMKQIMDAADHRGATVCWNSNDADLTGGGLEHNFKLVQDRLGATCHVRELNDDSYPYQKLINLLVSIEYAGWVLLECRTEPADKIAALKEQRALFDGMVARALG